MQISFLPHSDERLLEKFAKAQRQKAIAYLKEKGSIVKNEFFTREYVPVAQSSQVMERAWLLI